MKNFKNWLNRKGYNFEVEKNNEGQDLVFIKIEGMEAEDKKKIKSYLKRYKFNVQYRCNYSYILAYKEELKADNWESLSYKEQLKTLEAEYKKNLEIKKQSKEYKEKQNELKEYREEKKNLKNQIDILADKNKIIYKIDGVKTSFYIKHSYKVNNVNLNDYIREIEKDNNQYIEFIADIETEEQKTFNNFYIQQYKDILNFLINFDTEQKEQGKEVEKMNNKKELKPIYNNNIKGHKEYILEELKKYNSGALNFTHKRINNKMIEEYTKYFIYKNNTFMSVKPGKDYPSGYYEHVRSYNYKVDHVNKIILFTDKEIEEVEPIKEEFYNNEVEPAAEQIEDNYFYSDINLNNILKHVEEVKQFNNSKSIEYFGNYATPQRGSFRIEKNNNNFYIKAMIETKENYFEKLEIFETPEKAIKLYIDFLSKYQLDYIKYLESQKDQTEKENNNYISMTEEEHQELVKLSNIWSEKIPTDKEQGKHEFLHLLFKYQEQKKTKEELKKHINKLYAANKNIIEANKKKEGINNYLVDLLATEDILQQNNIIKNEFFTNAYNYIKSVS